MKERKRRANDAKEEEWGAKAFPRGIRTDAAPFEKK